MTIPGVEDWIWYLVSRPNYIGPPELIINFSSSPGIVVENTQSVGASLVVWLAGGLLAWTGASSFAELGASIPVRDHTA